MFDKLVDAFFKNLLDWPDGTFLVVLTIGVIAIPVLGIVVKLFESVDKNYGTKVFGVGRLVKKKESKVNTQEAPDGRASIYDTVEDEWEFTVMVDGRSESIKVSQRLFEKYDIYNVVNVEYIIGGLSHAIYILKVS